ncbi:methyltransferase [Amycolatopsis pittospori]|uniref:methyltransferase n=1 Tax=Amycolatopsis pittospori TaxID=2749434 RepID=UPI0015F07298|nr:methyltransferase [Amycolatopsis pittospori]
MADTVRTGTLLARLLGEHADAEGVLLDSQKVAATASARMHRAGPAQRCTTIGGDFFGEVPGGGDLYVLRQILHDWDDECFGDLLDKAGFTVRRVHRLPTAVAVIEAVPMP